MTPKLRALFTPRRRTGTWPSIPRTRAHFISVVLLAALLAAHSAKWITDLNPMLFDPDCQTDDVRIGLVAYHRFDPVPLLTEDPLSDDLYVLYQPPIRVLYRIAVPIFGLPLASKWVQGLALSLILVAAFLIFRSRRGGFAAAALLLFFAMHEPQVMNRIAGGLGRAFIFPLLMIWLAGAIAKSERTRVIATLAAALTQANAALIMLAAESLVLAFELGQSIYRLRGGLRLSHPAVARAIRFVALGLVCFTLASAYAVSTQNVVGRFPTFAEASKNPAFQRGNGWEDELPFPDPLAQFKKWVLHPLADNTKPTTAFSKGYAALNPGLAWALAVALLAFAILFSRPQTLIPVALLVASIGCYAAARVLAFRLYSPERYYSFGGSISTIALLVVGIGCMQLLPRLQKKRAMVRNYAAAGAIALLWLASGRTGVASGSASCVITQKANLPLYDFVRGLPPNARLLAHPYDADDLPFWTGRATPGGFEMCTVWFVDAHARCMKRMIDGLTAYYAIDKKLLFEYLEREKITHVLVQRERVAAPTWLAKSAVGEPLNTELKKIIAGRTSEELLLNQIPPQAMVFHHNQFDLVDVAVLKRFWVGL